MDEDIYLFYAFDWDDNLMYMDTEILCLSEDGQTVGISTNDFSKYRHLIGKEKFEYKGHKIVGYNDDPFINFRDDNGNKFLEDTIKAIQNNKFGPSWDDFVECLVNGSLFAIITARGHESDTIRSGIEYIIDNVLNNDQRYIMMTRLYHYYRLYENEDYTPKKINTLHSFKFSRSGLVQYYLDQCDFVGISSPSRGGTVDSPEKAKEEALMDFKVKINDLVGSIGGKAKIGFSDDDPKNANHIENLFINLHHESLPNIKEYTVKNTNNGEIKKMKKII